MNEQAQVISGGTQAWLNTKTYGIHASFLMLMATYSSQFLQTAALTTFANKEAFCAAVSLYV